MQAQNVVVVDLECLAQIALQRLLETKKKHSADAHETYFTANGQNYRIRIPNDSGVRRKGESNANT